MCVRLCSDQYQVHSIIIPVNCECVFTPVSFLMCVAGGVNSSPTTPPNGEQHTSRGSFVSLSRSLTRSPTAFWRFVMQAQQALSNEDGEADTKLCCVSRAS